MKLKQTIIIAAILTSAAAFNLGCGNKNSVNLMDSFSADSNNAKPTTGDGVDYSDSTAPASWTRVEIKTSVGTMIVALNPAQKEHHDNFVKLVNSKFYDGVLFHRVIKNFMIQTGDPKSKLARAGAMLGDGDPGYTLPSEIKDTLYHFRGALSAARQADQVNPMKRSSGSQFFIVSGTKYSEADLRLALGNSVFQDFIANPANSEYNKRGEYYAQTGNQEALDQLQQEVQALCQPKLDAQFSKIPDNVKKRYMNWGGTPHLDNQYTVFGKLISGYHVLDFIESSVTDRNDRPEKDIKILSASVIKGQ
ncbi:MAG: hypothetical protein RLZZ252_245 [Bacteroidota bacterium]|jgi:cyclophilin family peptidyl-prolyl cis-trans isomerase